MLKECLLFMGNATIFITWLHVLYIFIINGGFLLFRFFIALATGILSINEYVTAAVCSKIVFSS
jgi:hypothetical protein